MKPTRFLALIAFALPVLLHAHPGHGGHELTWDFASGAAHPFSGWDHLLAMISVGLWAATLAGRSRWLVPAAFVGFMAIGAWLGRSGLAFSGLEQGIAASLLGLGLLIATSVRMRAGTGMAIVGTFALFHGMAHGVEMPATSGVGLYGTGFIAATILLHIVGIGLGGLLKAHGPAIRVVGGAVALVGAVALLS